MSEQPSTIPKTKAPPKGIVTSESLSVSNVVEEEPKKTKAKTKKLSINEVDIETPQAKNTARFIYDEPIKSDAPKSVYRETATDSKTGKTTDWIWWMGEDSVYVGLQKLVKLKKYGEGYDTVGDQFSIPYSKENVKTIVDMKTMRTVFAHKHGSTRLLVKDPADF